MGRGGEGGVRDQGDGADVFVEEGRHGPVEEGGGGCGWKV